MLIRWLPLYAGVVPVIAVSLAYWLGVQHDVLPACVPIVDGCTSISATGRYMPGSLLFRAIMMPQSVVLVFLWYFAARWLSEISSSRRAASVLLFCGLVGATALIIYVTFLGTRGPVYEFMRRFGIYLYFLGTAVAQLVLAITVFRNAATAVSGRLKRLAVGMLAFCGLPFLLGILNLVLKNALAEPDFVENRIEWISAVLMQAYFVVLYVAWRHTGFQVAITTNPETNRSTRGS